ncbi:MAG: recombinase family protein [Ethanoligenens sp.]
MQAAKNITVIPATRMMHTGLPRNAAVRKRVAGYARVSTDSEEQQTSYEAQVDYYTNYIQSKPEWEFVRVYTDEGISALNTKRRDGFNEMIQDALDGKIDLIVTKSVSRFARNTVDSLTTVRKLKEKGIEVYFEKEGIATLDSKGELLITIMSSLAQEESRSISENVTWGQRKRFADGKVTLPYGQFLGYRKGADGLPEIVPEEAETVRTIYRLFIQGKTTNAIAATLTKQGIPTPGGKKKWQSTTIESILTNEKYKGDAVLQKKYTVDFLTKKQKINEGEVPQFYVKNSHPAIILPDEWNRVQDEMTRRKATGRHHNSMSPFSAKIICGDCGEYYGSKVWHSTSKYRRTVWQCNAKFTGAEKCRTPHLYEDDIKALFLNAVSELMIDREALIEDGRALRMAFTDFSCIDKEIGEITSEMDVLSGLVQKLVDANATTIIDQTDYRSRYDNYIERYDKAKKRLDILREQRQIQELKGDILSGFLFELGELYELPMVFKEATWDAIVDHVTVHTDGRVVFTFKNGTAVTETL